MGEECPEVNAVWGPNPLCERGYAFAINASPDGTKLCYGSGKNVVVRDTTDNNVCSIATVHRAPVMVAKFSNLSSPPMIISGDDKGHTTLFEVKGNNLEVTKQQVGIGGRVYDISWYANDKGLATVGDAKGNNGRVYTVSGTDQGSISGTKRLTAVDIYFYDDNKNKVQDSKLVTASDDLKLRVYTYKGGFALQETDVEQVSFDQNFNQVRFSPDGKCLAAVGGKQIKLLDAENGFKVIAETTGNKKLGEHTSNIYAVCWGSNSDCIFTACGDKTVKLWAVDGSTLKHCGTVDYKGKANVGGSHMDFQVGCCNVGDGVNDRFVSLSLCGDLHYHTVQKSGSGFTLAHESTVIGPTMEVISMDVHKGSATVAVATGNGEVIVYDKAGEARRMEGVKDPKKCVGIANFGDFVSSTGWDDVVRTVDCGSLKANNRSLAVGEQPLYMRRAQDNDDLAVVVSRTKCVVFSKSTPNASFAELKAGNSEFTCAALSANGTALVVGSTDKKVTFYKVTKGSITQTAQSAAMTFFPTALAFSNDGKFVAAGLKSKYVMLLGSGGEILADGWSKHTATVNDVDFSPDGNFVLSSGTEGDIAIWDVNKPNAFKPLRHFKRAHITGVQQARWLDNSTFFSTGCFDGATKRWGI